MKHVYTFFNTENPIVLILFTTKVNLSTEIIWKSGDHSAKRLSVWNYGFFAFFHRYSSQAFCCTEALAHIQCGSYFDVLDKLWIQV